MPTYEYACSACGHKFEEFQSIKAKPIVVCPKCKKRKVKRLISSGAGFIFKGSGFYTTDYRSDSYKASAKSDSSASSGTPAASPVKSDSAAPAKSDSKSATPASSTPAPATPAAAPAPASSKGKNKGILTVSDSPHKPRPIGNDGTVFRCPICKTLLPHINVPTFPFCSDRCRLLDLNNWIDGKYTLSRPVDPSDEEEDLPRTPPLPPGPHTPN